MASYLAARPGDWEGLVVLCSSTPWHGPRLAERNLASPLADRVPVLYVEPPLSWRRARTDPALSADRSQPRLSLVRPGLARLRALALPAKDRPGVARVTSAVYRHQIAHAVACLTDAPAAIIHTSAHRSPFEACPGALRVYWVKDDYSAASDLLGMGQRRLRRGVQAALGQADEVVVASQALLSSVRRRGYQATLMPNGCDVDTLARAQWAQAAPDVDLPPPIAGFVGNISERIDFGLLHAIADRGISVLLVGPRQRTLRADKFDALLARSNVRWVGARPFEELPRYFASLDVGLVPYRDDPFNRASFPLKVLEYLAAGRGVVSTPLPAVTWLATDLIFTASTPEGFVEATERALREGAIRQSERQAFAAKHSWDQRVEVLLPLLDRRVGPTGRRRR